MKYDFIQIFNQPITDAYNTIRIIIDKRYLDYLYNMSQTAYIDELIKAEEEANNIIQNAQKQRQRKLKEAREAAEQEVNKYKEQKEGQFERMKERKQDKEFEVALEKETEQEIRKIKQDFEKNKDKVIDMLVSKVLEVDLSIPNSVKEKFVKKK